MILKSPKLDILNLTNAVIDVTKLNAYEHSIPKKQIPKNDPTHPHWGSKLNTISGIPISYIITPAKIYIMDVAEPLIKKKRMDDYGETIQPKHYLIGCWI